MPELEIRNRNNLCSSDAKLGLFLTKQSILPSEAFSIGGLFQYHGLSQGELSAFWLPGQPHILRHLIACFAPPPFLLFDKSSNPGTLWSLGQSQDAI